MQSYTHFNYRTSYYIRFDSFFLFIFRFFPYASFQQIVNNEPKKKRNKRQRTTQLQCRYIQFRLITLPFALQSAQC